MRCIVPGFMRANYNAATHRSCIDRLGLQKRARQLSQQRGAAAAGLGQLGIAAQEGIRKAPAIWVK